MDPDTYHCFKPYDNGYGDLGYAMFQTMRHKREEKRIKTIQRYNTKLVEDEMKRSHCDFLTAHSRVYNNFKQI